MNAAKLALNIPELTTGRALETRPTAPGHSWSLASLRGRIVELRNTGASGALTWCFDLIYEAQHGGEPVAWISATDSLFYAPDARENGIDLGGLIVVRLKDAKQASRAASILLKSGAFGLLIVDLGEDLWIPRPLQKRISHDVRTYESTLVYLTTPSPGDEASLESASLRAEPHIESRRSELISTLEVKRDRRSGTAWGLEEVCRGPIGMR